MQQSLNAPPPTGALEIRWAAQYFRAELKLTEHFGTGKQFRWSKPTQAKVVRVYL